MQNEMCYSRVPTTCGRGPAIRHEMRILVLQNFLDLTDREKREVVVARPVTASPAVAMDAKLVGCVEIKLEG